MFGSLGAEWLALWAAFVVLGLLARRDRRLLYWMPAAGLAVVIAGGVVLLAWAWATGASRPPLPPRGSLHVLVIVAGGFGIPVLLCWCGAYVRRDASRLWGCMQEQRWWAGACIGLGVAAALVYFALGREVVNRWDYSDEVTLFESDGPLYVRYMNGTATGEYPVTHKHPLYVLPVRILYRVLTVVMSPRYAPLVGSALAGGVSLALAAAYFRAVSRSRLLAVLLAVALGMTTGHLVFGAIPETYAPSAAGLILLHWLLARRGGGQVRLRHEVPAAVLAVGMTVTHVFTAAVCFLAGGARRQRSLVRWSAGVVTVLAVPLAVQSALIPATVAYEEAPAYRREERYFASTAADSPGRAARNVLCGVLAESVAAPSVVVHADADGRTGLHLGAYQGWLARACLAVWWLALLIAGTLIIARRAARRRTLWAALACLGAAALLHVFYGNAHVFLFSCTFAFYLFAIVAHGLRLLPWRFAVVATAVLAALLAVNNWLFCGQWLATLSATITGG